MKYDELILAQSSEGKWQNIKIVAQFFNEDIMTYDLESLSSIKIILGLSDIESVCLTILALFVLENRYADIESEWHLIAKKARTFLKAQGVTKVDSLMSNVKLTLR